MSLESVKNSFIKHLTDKFDKNIFGKFNPEDMSLFEYLSEFNTFLTQEANLDVSLFSFSATQIESIVHEISIFNEQTGDTVKDRTATGYFEGEKQELSMIEMYSDILKDPNVIGMFDTDGDSKLSEEEMAVAMENIAAVDGVDGEVSLKDFVGFQTYVQDFIANHPDLEGDELTKALLESINGLDGDTTKLSATDFKKLGEQIEEMGKLDAEKPLTPEELVQQLAETFESSVPPAMKTSQFQGASLNTHASNYTGPSGELKSHELRDAVINTDEEIAGLENQIVEQNKLKLEAAKASSEYFAENKYDEKVQSLNTVISDINTLNKTLTSSKSDLHETQYDLNAAKIELDNLADPVVFTEYADEIKATREKLENDIKTLTEKEQTLQQTIRDTETKLSEAETQRDQLQQQIKTIEDNNPDSESKAKIAEYNANIESLQQQIQTKKNTKQDQETKLNTQREQEIKDSEVYGLAQAYRQSEFVKFMMDYATNPETKKKYDALHASNYGAYCAVFTSDVSEIMFAATLDRLGIDPKTFNSFGDQNSSSQGLTGDQMAMAASAWGDKLAPALKALGVIGGATVHLDGMSEAQRTELVRQGKIYPGMTFEYNGGYHTGFIESINKDLSWNTIEGNTSVKYADGKSENGTVGSHKRDATNMRMYAATDSTMKALIWAYQAGKITLEQLRAMTYASRFSSMTA